MSINSLWLFAFLYLWLLSHLPSITKWPAVVLGLQDLLGVVSGIKRQ